MNLSITEIVKKGRFAETNQEASALLNKSPWLAESQNFPAATARTFAVFCVFYVMSQLWLSNEMFLSLLLGSTMYLHGEIVDINSAIIPAPKLRFEGHQRVAHELKAVVNADDFQDEPIA